EGKKTLGIELAEQGGWGDDCLPDVIVFPTGGGTGIVGMWKAFDELGKLGWIGPKRPKMAVVQSTGCAPLVRAFEQGADHAQPWEGAATIAAGIRVPSAIGDYLMLTAVPSHEVRIDASKPLRAEPHTGHNRWHPDIPPILRVDPGDRVALETRDALDGQITAQSTAEEVGKVNLNVVHPLTGPVYVNGAEPGDLLEIKILEVEPAPFGFTVQIPGFGFLRDQFPDPFIVRWRIA